MPVVTHDTHADLYVLAIGLTYLLMNDGIPLDQVNEVSESIVECANTPPTAIEMTARDGTKRAFIQPLQEDIRMVFRPEVRGVPDVAMLVLVISTVLQAFDCIDQCDDVVVLFFRPMRVATKSEGGTSAIDMKCGATPSSSVLV